MKKEKIALAAILLAALCLSGCGNRQEGEVTGAIASKDYVYKAKELELGLGPDEQINRLFRVGDDIYGQGYSWDDEGENTLLFFQLNEEGAIEEKSRFTLGQDTSIDQINMDKDANLYGIKSIYRSTGSSQPETEETQEAGEDWEAEEEVEEYVEERYLIKMNIQGEEEYSVFLNELPEVKKIYEDYGYFYVDNMILGQEAIYLIVYNNLLKFDLEGNLLEVILEKDNQLGGSDYITAIDGSIIAVLYNENGMAVAPVDLEKGTMGEAYTIPGVSYEYSFFPGIGYDLYMANMYGLYGYNLGDEDKVLLMSYIDSDFDFYNIFQVTGINDKEFFAMYDTWEDGSRVLAKFIKVPPEEVKEKQVINLAMAYTDWNVRQEAIKFNKENETYRISIQDYGSLYSGEYDYKAGVTRLNTDIISGNIPDIILLDESMPIDSYINKGLFEDLKSYINKDSELDIENYMPNIIEAFSVGGKLYTLVPSYSIQTIAAKTADVGEERGWTVQEAREILSSKPEGTQFLADITRGDMMERCISMSGNQFIDWEKGSCNFNSDGFIQMLEFIGTFPEEIDNSIWMEDEYWNNYESMWREGKVLATVLNLSNFRGYSYTEKGTFGEKITMVGFPSSNEDGSVIRTDLQLALSSKSKCKDGAWEFLRIFLLDDYQENISYGLPLSIKRLDELAAEAMEKPYYTDENNERVEYDDTYYMSGVEIVIPPMTEQETKALKEQLYSFTQVYKFDEALINIINEEAAPYFSGQKSAKDVAGIIQSRVQIYVNENR